MTVVTPPLDPASERRFEQLRSLTEFSRALTYSTAVDEVVRLATARAADLLGADSAILMLGEEDGRLRVRATHGVSAERVEDVCDRLDESLIRRLQTVLDLPAEEAFLGVPLVAGGAVIGLLAVVRERGTPPGPDEEWLLSALADQVAVALEMSRLEAALEVERGRPQGGGAADEAHGQALATLSHDLRSPLNAIDSYAELLEMELLGPVSDRQREALGRIRLSGRHLLGVLESVLEMTRISAGVVRVHSREVPLARVVNEAMHMVSPGATAKGLALEIDSDQELSVEADPDRLRQALMNVLGNAVKYTPAGGQVRVSAGPSERDGRRWGTVRVVDTGPGIPRDKLQSIFRAYFRIHSGDATSQEGTGLGLAIARELVRQMGGDIEAESEVGQGATFTLRVPASG